jgi:flagellin FlaB
MFKFLKNEKFAAVGIGALMIFIALVLLAGIAASVLIQTSNVLELQTLKTGRDTTDDVSTGLEVFSVEGYAADGADISRLAIMVRPRSGSKEIDLSTIYLEISNSEKKVVMNYSTSEYSDPGGLDDIFSDSSFPEDDYAFGHALNRDGTQFGLLVVEDDDDSITKTQPIINKGDKVFITINATGVFNNLAERTEVWGRIVPEIGYEGFIEFTTPSTYSDNVMEILLDM